MKAADIALLLFLLLFVIPWFPLPGLQQLSGFVTQLFVFTYNISKSFGIVSDARMCGASAIWGINAIEYYNPSTGSYMGCASPEVLKGLKDGKSLDEITGATDYRIRNPLALARLFIISYLLFGFALAFAFVDALKDSGLINFAGLHGLGIAGVLYMSIGLLTIKLIDPMAVLVMFLRILPFGGIIAFALTMLLLVALLRFLLFNFLIGVGMAETAVNRFEALADAVGIEVKKGELLHRVAKRLK